MSSFQALATAIAAQVRNQYILGATALCNQWSGAIFWMWIAGIRGIAAIYAEALMAQVPTVGADS